MIQNDSISFRAAIQQSASPNSQIISRKDDSASELVKPLPLAAVIDGQLMDSSGFRKIPINSDNEEACESVRSEGDSGIKLECNKEPSITSRSDCQMFNELDSMGELTLTRARNPV